MCGRNALFATRQELEECFGATIVTDGGYTPRYNIAPDEALEVITNQATDEIEQYRWGLVPSWTDSPTEDHQRSR